MLRTLLCVSFAACAVTSPDPIDGLDSPPPVEGPVGVFAQLHDDAASVPELAGVQRERRVDTTRCGGVAVETRISGVVTDADQPLANLLLLGFPTQLDFSDANREAELRRFQGFANDLRARGMTAREHYIARLDAATDPAGKLAATARLVQVHRHLAALLVRAEIPLDVRTGEFAADKTGAYCEKMASIASPYLVQAEEAVRACLGMSTGTRGWWTTVCKP